MDVTHDEHAVFELPTTSSQLTFGPQALEGATMVLNHAIIAQFRLFTSIPSFFGPSSKLPKSQKILVSKKRPRILIYFRFPVEGA